MSQSHLFEKIEWQPLESSCGVAEDCATHRGTLKVETIEIACYRFSDGSTEIDMEDIEQFFRGCPRAFAPSPYPEIADSPDLIDYRIALLLGDDDERAID